MYIYVIGTEGRYQKIGFSNDVVKRLATLQTGNPEQLAIHHYEEVPADRVRLLERHIHKELNHKRIIGEWFALTPDEAKAMLQHAVIRWLDDETI
jgi:hypothetical protein